MPESVTAYTNPLHNLIMVNPRFCRGTLMGDWPRLSALAPPTARGEDDVHTAQPVQER